MPTTTTPAQRLQRVLGEGARLMAQCPGQTSIDVTPDVIAMLDGVQTGGQGSKTERNLFEPKVAGGDVPTLVEIP